MIGVIMYMKYAPQLLLVGERRGVYRAIDDAANNILRMRFTRLCKNSVVVKSWSG